MKEEKSLDTIRAKFQHRIYPNGNAPVLPGVFCVSVMELTEAFPKGSIECGRTIRVAGTSIPTEDRGGIEYEILGEYEEHPKYGKSIHAKMVCPIMPDEIAGLKAVLGSGMLPGIGPKSAGKIVDYFGTDTLRILESEPDRLLEVKGISEKMVEKIRQSNFPLSRELKEAVLFLQGYGLSTRMALRVGNYFHDQTINEVQKNPFIVIRVPSIGFSHADMLAKNMGLLDATDQRRICAAIEQSLRDIYQEGHMCYSKDAATVKVLTLLGVQANLRNTERVHTAIEEEIREHRVRVYEQDEKQFLYSPEAYDAETMFALGLSNLKRTAATVETGIKRVQEIVHKTCSNLKICLDPTQEEAVVNGLYNKVSIITGGPGTGKTTILKVMCLAYRYIEGKDIHLMAPTGRAARRMSESTGECARTIHSTLGLGVSEHGEEVKSLRELDGLVVVDEASMIDGFLARALVRSLASTARLVVIGDVDQLPSVGPGAVLKNMIESASIPVTQLKKTFRQKGGSAIIANTSRINRGDTNLVEVPGEFAFWPCEEDDQQQNAVAAYLAGVKKYGLESTALLTPFRRHGSLACNTLNPVLQNILNPPSPKKAELVIKTGKKGEEYTQIFREGDPIMAQRNFQGRDISNGDIGRVEKIDKREMKIRFDEDRTFEISGEELYMFELAYAMTVHKSQGSEYDYVVMICSMSHQRMLRRNLLYTGSSRAKNVCVIVGQRLAVEKAILTPDSSRRGSFLKSFLNHYL